MSRSSSILLVLALSLAACASVLGFRPTEASHPFEHRAHVVKGVSCSACHGAVAQSGSAEPLHVPSDATCIGCHAKPHEPRGCTGCHGSANEIEAAAVAHTHIRFGHRDHMAEVHGDCVRCHESVAATKADTLLPTMSTCFECHTHREQWTSRDCDRCHVDLAAEETLPRSHLVHDGDFVREHGVRAASARDLCASCHSERSCAACHGVGTVPALAATLHFDDVPLSGLHRAGFRARHADEARADPGLCTTCHSESSCLGCHDRQHVSAGTTSRSPHAPGWVTGAGGGDHGTQARIDPSSCAACHGGAGEKLCVGCHTVGGPGGSPHGPGFRSQRSKTHDLPCRECHRGGA